MLEFRFKFTDELDVNVKSDIVSLQKTSGAECKVSMVDRDGDDAGRQ